MNFSRVITNLLRWENLAAAAGCLWLGVVAGCMADTSPATLVRQEQRILFVQLAADSGGVFRDALQALQAAGTIEVDTALSAHRLEEDSLRQYSVVILAGADGYALQPWHQRDVERYVQAGGALVCLGVTTRQAYVWPWMDSLLEADLPMPAAATPVALPEDLLTLRTYDGGRVGVASLQHSRAEVTAELVRVLPWLIGDNRYDPSRISAPRAPHPSRFTRVVLDEYDVNEPMELAVLPDGRVIYIERRGKMKLYHPRTRETRVIAQFDVCIEGNYEDGLLGLTVDPNFAQNHYLYLYYSPGASCTIKSQYLSRFTMIGDSLILGSEKVILEVPVQRETCCHSGGSVTFGPDGNLYLSTGDNTSSKESSGYTPIDERPGRAPFDAQKSSGNTQDLRGKILRIRPTLYGGYTIPRGNLFEGHPELGRPEIYTMGCRNPFRITVDARTGYVYWGDVGPDVGQPGVFGPQSYDEVNQARGPGNFGWPYFVANNQAYPDRDFTNDQVGPYFNPAQPVNSSPNNTGSRMLPPANQAWIWYPYGPSEDFPYLGIGSRSAMAGPVYRRSQVADTSQVAFPAYYEGKLFVYEWARSWIRVISMDEAGNLTKIEPFLPDLELVKPIDMEFGPDGALYYLEYGQNYFMKNPEARLVRIEYAAGNRKPDPAISSSARAGIAPLSITLSASASADVDPRDSLRYEWRIGDSLMGTGENIQVTFARNGTYRPILRAIDKAGAWDTVSTLIRVGNTPPTVQISWGGNTSFWFGGEKHPYTVAVSDPEDQAAGRFDPARTQVRFIWADDGQDLEVMLGGDGKLPEVEGQYLRGYQLVNNSDCKSCHAMEVHSVGPSYLEIAARYQGQSAAVQTLATKIITGGNGNWGEKIMAGHPQHTLEETREMVLYILSLSDRTPGSLPLQGSLSLPARSSLSGGYLLAATYQDGGANGMPDITTRAQVLLRHPRMEAEACKPIIGGVRGKSEDGWDLMVVKGLQNGSVLGLGTLDLTGLTYLEAHGWPSQPGRLLVRLDSPAGEVIGTLDLTPQTAWQAARISLTPVTGRRQVFLTVAAEIPGEVLRLDWIQAGK